MFAIRTIVSFGKALKLHDLGQIYDIHKLTKGVRRSILVILKDIITVLHLYGYKLTLSNILQCICFKLGRIFFSIIDFIISNHSVVANTLANPCF